MRSGKADGRFVSPDVWVMARPGPAFAALAGRATQDSLWRVFRRPLLVAVVLGCVTSLITFPGITLRLAGPAALCWSFVPLAEVLGLAVACAGEGARVGFGRKVDLFFMGYLPWLLWPTGIATTFSFLSTARAFVLLDWLWLGWAGAIVIAWSAWIDFCTVSWNLSAARAIDEIHRQGGVAIAAHPTMQYWAGYDSEAMRKLDGAEVVHPIAWQSEDLASELRQFYARARRAAIGDSDYHGPGPLGVCRTYVLTRDTSEQGILDAIRKGRTVVYDRGQAYGDAALIRLAAQDGRLPAAASHTTEASGALSRITGILGLVALFVFGMGEVVTTRLDSHPIDSAAG